MHTHEIKINGEIKHAVIGVFGQSVEANYEDTKAEAADIRQAAEDGGEELFRCFDTQNEAYAYIQGLSDMDGWMAYTVGSDLNRHEEIFGSIADR